MSADAARWANSRRGLWPPAGSIAFEVTWENLSPVLKAGTRVVDLDVEGHVEKAMFRDIQWDTFGMAVKHIDLLRIDPNERVEVQVPIVFKGIAAGALAGGILDHHLHSVTLECLAIQIPDGISVKISELQIGQAIHVSELELPPNTAVKNDPETVVVQVKQAPRDRRGGGRGGGDRSDRTRNRGSQSQRDRRGGRGRKERKEIVRVRIPRLKRASVPFLTV